MAIKTSCSALPPAIDGYRWIGNSDYDSAEEAKRNYSEALNIPIDQLCATENTSSDFKWAIYKQVG